MRLGIDIGSLFLGGVVLNKGKIIRTSYREHEGSIRESFQLVLSDLNIPESLDGIESAGITGRSTYDTDGHLDNLTALITGCRYLLPKVRNVISIGGESFCFIVFDEKGHYQELIVNPPCASGTGSFIEQQAERLKLSVTELSLRAARFSGKTPVIATRCAVFAKTDIIHAMQEGYSVEAVCAGLCEGIADTVLESLIKGRDLFPPLAVVGGVSKNGRIIEAMKKRIHTEIIVPEFSHLCGAVGAALMGQSEQLKSPVFTQSIVQNRKKRNPITPVLSSDNKLDEYTVKIKGEIEVFLPKKRKDTAGGISLDSGTLLEGGVYLGIDVGSTSTKACLINHEKVFIGGFYTQTAGDAVKATRRLLEEIQSTFPLDRLLILGAATTGSGRKMIKELFNAEMTVDEITAHARAAVELNPEVDTIIEIGGQDSKFTLLKDGLTSYAAMNYVCAAGTGSFIEEQAKRLNIRLDQFSRLAEGARAPYTSDRCTVYMERDLSALLHEGWPKEALAAAVLHGVRDNYLAKVVGKTPLGNHIVFQGATARNSALVECFRQFLNKPISVSPLCHLTGAYGAALLCLEEADDKKSESSFLFDAQNLHFHREVCKLCSNHCILTVINQNTAWGMKCGREYTSGSKKALEPSRCEQRYREHLESFIVTKDSNKKKQKLFFRLPVVPHVGLPVALYQTDYLVLWSSFLHNLGLPVRMIRPDKNTLDEGKDLINSDFCSPMIMAHGLLKKAIEEKCDYIFFPAIVNAEGSNTSTDQSNQLFKKKKRDTYYCYYSQYLPTIVNNLSSCNIKDKLISPLIAFNHDKEDVITQKIHHELKSFFKEIEPEQVRIAYEGAKSVWDEYRQKLRRWPSFKDMQRELKGKQKLQIVLLGRPYVAFENQLNLNLIKLMEDSGADVYWQDELPDFDPVYAKRYSERMHWEYGRRIIQCAEACAQMKGVYTVFLSCFRCSPDSFLISYVKDIMAFYEKPHLILQLDEHASDVGCTTRIEASFRSFLNHRKREHELNQGKVIPLRDDRLEAGNTVLVPYLDNLICGFWADCFTKAGYNAVLLDASLESLNKGYQYASGGECMPLVSIIGSALRTVKEQNLKPEETFFYLPTICMACNFPQFPILSDLAFHSAGIKGVKIGLINSMAPGEVLPRTLSVRILEANIIGCLLYKMYHRIIPYEINAGETDKVLSMAKEHISRAILEGMDLRKALGDAVEMFLKIERDESGGRKPRIGLLGDLYVKFNSTVNQRLTELVKQLGAEILIPSMTEYTFHFFDADIRLFGDEPKSYKLLKVIEKRYEAVTRAITGEQEEPDFNECLKLMEDYGIKHYIAGETSISVGRALYFIDRKMVDAILHINPIFCCPGVVSSSIFTKIQKDFQIPIINLFYDGSGDPNRIIIPHIHFLKKRLAAMSA
jgi:predicted CoA-substrate-specific enzyme activase